MLPVWETALIQLMEASTIKPLMLCPDFIQDIHVMIFVGFGFLMVFLKKYGYSSLGFNFLLAALVVQWSILCQGFYELNSDYKIEIGLTNLYKADVATATVLISMGAVLGRTSHNQLVLMGLLEIAAYCLNNEINVKYLKAVDVGGSITIHTFGAYFGLAVSYVLAKKHQTEEPNLPQSSYTSNILAMLGTIFLWVYWPSFNSIDLEKDRAHRAIVNTYLSLAASCVVTFAASQMGSKNHKFDIVHIQNSTLAGGVAIGACAHLMVQPYGAVFIGMIAGLFSVYGYTTISAFLESKFKILDTCGVNNLHGIPGILGGLISIIMAAIATEQQYQKTLYEVFPARANPIISQNPEYIHLQAGDGRSASQQAGYQALLIIVTISIAIVSGLISGICLMNFSLWNNISPDSFYDDSVFWDLQVNDDVETDYRPTKWRVKEKNISKISVQ
ncbi:unnamed protein product [Ceutorhynchus assimilis]|uniref:Ammonium transporter AmtB-like domain-containing protein n=1 Tax=Ceutorhynchus assimilis TaxID=467358 RepID=A0A9N9MID8_9CUCU|nr:unnamed protein product [Ceutorhynchus assimilis]